MCQARPRRLAIVSMDMHVSSQAQKVSYFKLVHACVKLGPRRLATITLYMLVSSQAQKVSYKHVKPCPEGKLVHACVKPGPEG